MISDRGGLYGKMKATLNPKLFFTHCPPYCLILVSKVGQKELPADIEKLYQILSSFSRIVQLDVTSSVARKRWWSLTARILQ